MARNQHVLPRDGKWAVKAEGSRRASRVVATQQEALDVARRIARNQGVTVVVHEVDGHTTTAELWTERSIPRWLAIAGSIKAHAPETPLHVRPRHPDASVERVRALAGIIELDGPVPSTDMLDD